MGPGPGYPTVLNIPDILGIFLSEAGMWLFPTVIAPPPWLHGDYALFSEVYERE